MTPRSSVSTGPVLLAAGALALGVCVGAPAVAGAAQQPRLTKVGTFDQPIYVTAPKGDRSRLFVVQKSGRIRVLVRGTLRRTPVLDISRRITSDSEQGLLSMAFSPGFTRNRTFFVNYTDKAGDTRVVRYKVKRSNRNVAIPSSARTLLHIDQPYSNHNGGQLQFGPDGLLYVGMGDGGGGGDPQNRAQNLNSPLGKILVIPASGKWTKAPAGSARLTVPFGPAFRSRPPVQPRIYAYGLRNPWRFSFDRSTGDLIIADVGQDKWEEVDVVRAGAAAGTNFGWRVFEGPERITDGRARGAVAPVLSRPHSSDTCSITGGYVVRDRHVPALTGRYVYADFCGSDIRSASLTGGVASNDRATGLRASSVVSFGEDGRGRVYVVSLNGQVYRIR